MQSYYLFISFDVFKELSECELTLYDSCKMLKKKPKTLKKGIPKVNCMLLLGHLDDMHGVGLL